MALALGDGRGVAPLPPHAARPSARPSATAA